MTPAKKVYGYIHRLTLERAFASFAFLMQEGMLQSFALGSNICLTKFSSALFNFLDGRNALENDQLER
jgi:hypothetical protein